MPYRKRARKTKRTKKYVGGRFKQMVRSRFSNRDLHYFKRACPFSNSTLLTVAGTVGKSADAMTVTLVTAGAGIQYGAFSLKFALADIVNSTEMTLLFDSYQIQKIVVKILPFYTQSTSGAAVGATLAQTVCLFHSIIDYDDADIPTATDVGISEIRQFSSYRVKNITTGKGYWQRSLVPRTAVPVYGGGAFANYVTGPKNMWLDCNSPSTEHYGLKVIVEANNSGTDTKLYFKCEYTMYLKLKSVR